MMLNIEIEDSLAYILATSRGWTPTIEDTNAELVGDSYPVMENPVSAKEFLEGYIPTFIVEFVRGEARKHIKAEFASTASVINSQVDNGDFDKLLLMGDFDAIKDLVRSNL